jgi:hypothetical protein
MAARSGQTRGHSVAIGGALPRWAAIARAGARSDGRENRRERERRAPVACTGRRAAVPMAAERALSLQVALASRTREGAPPFGAGERQTLKRAQG